MPDQNIGFPTKRAVRQPGIDVDFTGHSASDPRLPGALARDGALRVMCADHEIRFAEIAKP
ncbi:MAG: hypothetical protein O2968_22910, partial [Acidobacteria bacterium]|nr:hypothetical protein [Acidobacteriota bacterium]